MSHSPKTAFCPLYFRAHGGQFTSKGLPILGEGIRGNCSRAFDCGTCSLMSEWLPEMSDSRIGWECDKCLKDTYWADKDLGVLRWLPGFYHDGGCTRCGWKSSFLQIIFRRQNG